MPEIYERSWSLRPQASELKRIRHEVSRFVGEVSGFSPERRADVGLAVSEVVTSALLQPGRRGRKPITVDVVVNGRVDIVVRDEAVAMRPQLGSTGAGLAIAIVTAIADDLAIEASEDDGTEIRVTFE